MEGNKLLGRNSSSDDDTENGIYTGRLDRKSAREPSFSRFQIFRCCLEVILIVCLLGTIGLLLRNDTRKAGAGSWQVWPAGSDYNHFVPHDVSSRGIPKPSGPDQYQITADAFNDRGLFNQTLSSWQSLSHAFVRATPYDGSGPQKLFSGDLFEISAFHQIHCLTSILEDFVLLAGGVPKEELPGYHSGVTLTWEEHKAHCFNYVRQALMCFADSTAEGHIEGDPHRVADHGVMHVCNDFDALLAWSKEPERALPKSWRVTD
ncbi:2OG-Fe(II) oxygenase protein [Rutstroemia sp. NJR-2017a BBW]|nr:2OG-Fe(II) oxygenase protein [Rutstroemia sp. NJR-2017a BBW]